MVLPRMSLENVARQLANAKQIVSVDTGLSHLSAALSRPNVTLYGPTDPGLIGGYGQNQHYLLSKSGLMSDISPQEIYDFIKGTGAF